MAVSAAEITRAIAAAIEESGASAVLLSGPNQNPRNLIVTEPDGIGVSVWAYAWNLTHGGRSTLPNEYRIQITGVGSPLPLNPLGETLLLGYEANQVAFAGFDVRRHREFTPGSPSIQMDIEVLRGPALQDGLGFSRKSNDDIAVAFRPDHFMVYLRHGEDLHRLGGQPRTLNLLRRVSQPQADVDEDIDQEPAERRRILREVRQLVRLRRFRRQVLDAYGDRCAVTRLQLRLVEAAHILPVEAPGSRDDVRNGLALAPTYHRAYDSGLLYLDENYRMRVNAVRQRALVAENLHAGLDGISASLGERILLPQDRQQWPSVDLIRKANRFRQVP